MLANKKVTVVLPAYNAAQTLKQTFDEIPHDIVDDIILTDDASKDDTVAMARSLGIPTIRHDRNRGYGGNQKTCYTAALARGADIVVMLHPDYQYTPRLVTAMASMIASEEFDVVLGSRILGQGALVGGMPIYKYISNRFLTLFQNIMIDQSYLNIIPAIGHGAGPCWKSFRCATTLTTLFLTTRCWFRPSISGFGSVRSAARRIISRKRRRSILGVAWSTGSAC
jgi:glycosyltransferase involved in cell wall biosynthesis